MKTTTTKCAMGAIQQVCDAAKASDRSVIVVPDDLPLGMTCRQGDIRYVRVSTDHAHGAPTGKQVVAGSALGSRHTAEAPAQCYVGTTQPLVLVDGELRPVKAFLGACVVSHARFLCQHPEHGHYSLPAGAWQVTQDMDVRTRQRMDD